MKLLLALPALAACLCAQAPDYTADSIVNAANFQSGPLTPNMVTALFGATMSWDTQGMGFSDVKNGVMPTTLAGVQVFVAGYPAHLYYVSPGQVNLLVPNYLRPGVVPLFVARDGMAGPVVQVTLAEAAPALFQGAAHVALATHLDYSLVTPGAPAHAGEIIVLYAAGLGCTQPLPDDGALVSGLCWLCDLTQFHVLIGGATVDSSRVLFAGLAPGFAGLYQVNLRMPDSFTANPELRLAVGDAVSAAGVILPAQ